MRRSSRSVSARFLMIASIVCTCIAHMALLSACPLGQTGKIKIVMSPLVTASDPAGTARLVAKGSRTLLPTLQAHGYRLHFSGPSNTEFMVETSETVIEQDLGVGEWSISAEALDASSRAIAAGTAPGVMVSVFGTGQVSIDLTPGMAATGSIDVTLTWPADLTPEVVAVGGTLGSATIPQGEIAFYPAEHSARYTATTASGNYKLEFELVWGESPIKTRQEAVQVYDYLTTSGAIAVTSDYFNPRNRIIDHGQYDPAGLSDESILAAAALRVYFEHASTGQDIVGDSDGDSSTGSNYSGSEFCGLAILHAGPDGARYLCERESFEEGSSASWFTTHAGLQTNNRYNPAPAAKLSGFLGLSAGMRAAVDVAMFKFCWIDVWDGTYGDTTTGFISDGASFAANLIDGIEAFETANPGLVVPYWTMPLQTNQSFPAREAYNLAIRTYCAENGKWLLDIADLECHNDAGIKLTDGSGREILYEQYAMPDGGHLSATGRLKLAKAYWTLIAGIASELAERAP